MREQWKEMTISEYADILDNKRVPLSSKVRSEIQGEFPYCGANGIVDYINDWIFDGEHVLIAEDGGNFHEYTTRPITYLMNGKFWVNNHAHVLRAKNGEHKFLHYALQHKDITKYIIGSTRTKLNKSSLESIKIPLPPLPEQQKIAEILSTVDDKIDAIDEQITSTQELKKGLMQQLLTKGIGHTEFKDSELGMIPRSWEVIISTEVFELLHGYQFRDYDFTEIGTPIIKIGQITKNATIDLANCSFISELRTDEFKDKIIQNGDVLMALTGATLGKTCMVKNLNEVALQNYRVGKFEPKNNSMKKDYLFFLLSSPVILNQVFGKVNEAAQGNIGKSDFEKLKISVPPLQEQQQIASILSTVDEKLEVLTNKKDHYQELKKGLMQQLLTGKIRVNSLIDKSMVS